MKIIYKNIKKNHQYKKYIQNKNPPPYTNTSTKLYQTHNHTQVQPDTTTHRYNLPPPPLLQKNNPQNQHKTLKKINKEINLSIYTTQITWNQPNSTIITHNYTESTTKKKKKNCPNPPLYTSIARHHHPQPQVQPAKTNNIPPTTTQYYLINK